MPDINLEAVRTVGLLLLGSIGGLLGFIRKELAMGKKITFFRTMFAVCLAAFFAYLMKIGCAKFGMDNDTTTIIIGIASFLGPDIAIQVLEKTILKRYGIGFGYFPLDSAEKIPSTIGSTDYLRADVFSTASQAHEQVTATANGADSNSAANSNPDSDKSTDSQSGNQSTVSKP